MYCHGRLLVQVLLVVVRSFKTQMVSPGQALSSHQNVYGHTITKCEHLIWLNVSTSLHACGVHCRGGVTLSVSTVEGVCPCQCPL